ncbi:MAG: oxidoreductase family protein [Planctomycetota bacterium]
MNASSPNVPLTLQRTIAESFRGHEVDQWQVVQSLWSEYGKIYRVCFTGHSHPNVIVKHVRPPEQACQPRGWNTDRSHQRKLRSYEVEVNWYRDWQRQFPSACPMADCLHASHCDSELVLVLEDLDAAGYGMRHSSLPIQKVHEVLDWLAAFHAASINATPTGLWPVGTYWHLETRPDELAAMPTNHPLRLHAAAINNRLNQCPYPTIVHGDAKVANFCFGPERHQIAAVDFQYVGGGCGMKDVAYFLGSCLTESQCERYEETLLDAYFASLKRAVKQRHAGPSHQPDQVDCEELEHHYRAMYPLAWADFNRFLIGWCPDHPKLHRYSQRLALEAISTLG